CVTFQIDEERPAQIFSFKGLARIKSGQRSIQDLVQERTWKGVTDVRCNAALASKFTREIALHSCALNEDGLRLEEPQSRCLQVLIKASDEFFQTARSMDEHADFDLPLRASHVEAARTGAVLGLP